MSLLIPFPPMQPGAAPSRRYFLRYTGASAVVGSLWLAGCKKDETLPSPPTSISFNPASGLPGTTVMLVGTGFSSTLKVSLGNTAVSSVVVNDTTITVVIPPGATTGPFTVATAGGSTSSQAAFIVLGTTATSPLLIDFTPASAIPGAEVVATGINLTGLASLTINRINADFKLTGATTLRFTVPAWASAGLATVVTSSAAGTGTNGTGFTVLPNSIDLGSGDTGFLNYVYALEQLTAAFYTRVRAGAYYTGLGSNAPERLVLDDLYYHEVIHREFLKAALTKAGATPIPDLVIDFSSIDFTSRSAVLAAAVYFEDLSSSAYIAVGQRFVSPANLFIVSKIASVEARHAAVMRDLVQEGNFAGSDILSTSIERYVFPREVVLAINRYFVLGSKLEAAGL